MSVRARMCDNAQLAPTNMIDTREGYLLCRNVVLARTGTQDYGFWELPREVRDVRNGNIVTIHRHEDDVFSPETIESFRGAAFTDDHPTDDVGPHNYSKLMKGVVQNPRRGEGEHSNHLVGDILVYDGEVIRKIKAGKREVSCGYDASYDVVDGKAYQRKITGNHVSLVDAGRCGPECSIKDGRSVGTQEKRTMAFSKSRFMDALKGVLKLRDDEDSPEKKAAMAALEKELPDEGDGKDAGDDEGGESDGDNANHHHVTVNIGGSLQGADDKTRDGRPGKGKGRDARHNDEEGGEDEEAGAEDMDKEDLAAMITAATKSAVEAAVAPLAARIDELESAVEDVSDPDDAMTQDSVARAEVLKPGFQLPTMDAKPGSKAHRDAIVNLQRRVLTEAFATKDGRDCILPLVSSPRPNFATMPVGELGVVFRGASAAMGARNNARSVPEFRATMADGAGKRAPLTQDSWNKSNRDFWAPKGGAAH